MIEVEVRLFGGLPERADGHRTVTTTVPDGATVADLRARLAAEHPGLATLLPGVQVAVDLEVARDDAPLTAGQEVALLPPVAGGADDDAPRVVTGLRAGPFDVAAVTAAITDPSVGATVSFLGTVRDHATDLDDVVRLDYSAYDEMAGKVLDEVADEVLTDHPAVTGLALLHATGELAVGDHTILLVACAAHRGAAFAACADALERVKDRLPVWKREVTADGAHRWVGMTPPAGDP